jgi:hypothetical protein
MKYIIKESQVDSLIRVFSKLINSESYEGVCNVTVDYNNELSRFVINIFYDRKYLIDLGSKTSAHLARTSNNIGKKFVSFTGNNPLLYGHYEDCSPKHDPLF